MQKPEFCSFRSRIHRRKVKGNGLSRNRRTRLTPEQMDQPLALLVLKDITCLIVFLIKFCYESLLTSLIVSNISVSCLQTFIIFNKTILTCRTFLLHSHPFFSFFYQRKMFCRARFFRIVLQRALQRYALCVSGSSTFKVYLSVDLLHSEWHRYSWLRQSPCSLLHDAKMLLGNSDSMEDIVDSVQLT